MRGNVQAVLTGLGVGVGLMYYLDPERGRRRRALVRDKIAHSTNIGADALGVIGRDVSHRAAGVLARARGALQRRPVDDEVLVERVRAKLGRLVSHPHSVRVEAADGRVRLSGPILQAEIPRLMRVVSRVPGVRDMVNALDGHTHAENVPSLQGGSARATPRLDVLRREWAPATRLMVATSGTALLRYGSSRRDAAGTILVASGLGLLARAISNVELRRLTGIGARRRAVDVQKTVTISAPLDEVFQFWTNYENFPRFMSRVLDVRRLDDRRSHWMVAGPAGTPVEFDAEVSSLVPDQVFAWRSAEGAPVGHAGIVRFEPTWDGRTRVHIRMSYNPPGGWLGHGVAAAFGVDPKRSLDADLARLKTLLETGRPARDAAQPLHAV